MARARTSQLFDVENHITLDAILAPYRTGERDLARQHMDALRCRASAKIPTIILFDRGYPSLALIVYLLPERSPVFTIGEAGKSVVPQFLPFISRRGRGETPRSHK